jgi:hypothetical protein
MREDKFGTCMEKRNAYLKKKYRFECLDLDGRIVLKCIIKKLGEGGGGGRGAWTGFI